MNVLVKSPSECSEQEIGDFCMLVALGGRVEKEGLRARVRHAELLALCRSDDEVVGVAALKRPSETYRNGVFQKARACGDPAEYELEFGYAYTAANHRGKRICSGLLRELLKAATGGGVFSTTEVDSGMSRILRRQGFSPVGSPFAGTHTGSPLQVFVNDHKAVGTVRFREVPEDAWIFRQAVDRCGADNERKWSPQEEKVRQWCLHELLRTYGVDIRSMEIERPVKVGRRTHHADIVVTKDRQPYVVIECKARGVHKHEEAMKQSISYATAADMNAAFAAYTNGDMWWVRRRIHDQWLPVPDLPVFRDGDPCTDWRDTLFAVDRVAPVLFWLDEVVPAKSASRYFSTLQAFFYAENEITAGTDRKLLWTADHVLRVLGDVTRHPNYTGGKMSRACDELNKYWQERGVEPSFGGGDLWEMAHDAWADLSNLLDGARDIVSLDYQAMRVIQALLCYLSGMRGRRVGYQNVGAAVQAEIRGYIDLALTVRFNSRLPDIQDTILIGDLRDFCKAAWEGHLKKQQAWPWAWGR